MAIDIYINPDTNDLELDENGDLRLVGGDQYVAELGQTSSNAELVAQRIRWRLLTIKGEWFLDTTIGPDWNGVILVRNYDLGAVRAEILAALYSVDGVANVEELNLSVDSMTRELAVDFIARTDDTLLKATGTLAEVSIEVL